MKNHRTTIVFYLSSILLFSSCGIMLKEEAKITEEEKIQLAEVMDSISEETLLGYVRKLSSDRYAGRLTGTPEYRWCARWAASLFKKWGLKPGADSHSYLQTYPNPYTIVFVGGELSYNYRSRGRWRKKKYIYEKEYYPGSQSGDGEITAEVVYVGYGITAPELHYDEYAGVNVKGKIVLVEPEVPLTPQQNPQAFKKWRPYSYPAYKVKMAVAHGARGMLFNQLRVNTNTTYVQDFMVAQVGEAVVKDVFGRTGKTHDQVKEKIKTTLKPQSFRTHKVFTIKNFTEHHPHGKGYNVIGMIEGTDPLLKGEAIVLGANLDHVGFCYQIMPGANDNASGAAVMLGVAEAVAKSPIKPKRSLLFIAFGSKEQAFRGSRAYVEQPALPADKTVVLLNLDMVGCGDRVKALAALNYPEIWKFISEAEKISGRKIMEPLPFDNIDRPRSDAAVFINEGIPSILFRAYGSPTYPHTTRDTVKTVTPEVMTDLARIMFRAVLDLANSNRDFMAME